MHELFLDLETSGINPEKHSILSIGMVVSYKKLDDYQSFYREIKYDELTIMPKSMEINGIDLINQDGRISISNADDAAMNFLSKHYKQNIPIMPIGLNIGWFDLQFISRQMPKLANRLGYRSVDLNSILYMLAEKHSRDFKAYKKEQSDKAHETMHKLALGVDKHNALYDAVFNLCLYLLIKDAL